MNFEKLKGHIPEKVLAELHTIKEINGPLRTSHFLAQASHESGGFKRVVENLNYSAKGLLATFPTHFTPSEAFDYARKPEMIANRVYANRMGNGLEVNGSGWANRGRGYMMLTGAKNLAAFSEYIGEDCLANPELVSTKYPLASSAWYFTVNNIWKIADKGSSKLVVKKVTKAVQGAELGLDHRIVLFDKIYGLVRS